MIPLNCLIVDGDQHAREKLHQLLSTAYDVDVVADAGDTKEAIAAIGEHRPNLLFLEVHLASGTGFDVLHSRPKDLALCTVFTTAHDAYAVNAFRVGALDYLLKPFGRERLEEALTRAREWLSLKGTSARNETGPTTTLGAKAALERILVKLNDRYVVVRCDEIDWIEAAANYVVLHTRSGNHVLRKALSSLEEELCSEQFVRVSRSALINLDRVSEIQILAAGEHTVVLQNGARVPLTRGVRELQERLQFDR